MASGLFFGGLASGFQKQEALNNQQNYEQGLLQLEQQRMQQQQQNQKRAEYMQLRSQAIQDMQNTVTAVKNAHPDWSDAQVLNFPALVAQRDQLSGFDKNLGLDPNSSGSILAGMVAGKSEIQTAQAKAQATGELGLRQSEIAKNQAQTKVLNQAATSPDVASGDDNKLLTTLATRSGMTPEELDVMGQARAAGNSGVLQNLGRGKQGGEAVKAVNAWAIHSLMQQGLSPAEAAAKLNENTLQFSANKAGTTAGARTASTRAANLGIILDTAGSAVDAAVAASDALPRGQYVPVNQAIQSAQKAASSPELKVFAQKNLQLAELWAKSMNPTGTMRESDRELALSVLSTADSPETYKAAANAIKASIGLEKGAAIKFLKDRGLSPGASEKSDSGITVHGFTFTPSQ